MGIFLHMSISKSVTKSEWAEVYEETLELIKVFPLAERRRVMCKGIDTICLVPTSEREDVYGWHNEKRRIGWFASGDYETMRTAEEYALYKDMISDDAVEINAGDALLEVLPIYLNYDWEDSRFNHSYSLWGSKTQGEPYHIYLLGIACLIESRLGEKAFVYGDITRGQCKKAIELVNQYVKHPIDIPARCDMERFYKRVSNLQISEKEKLNVFVGLYLGTKNAEFGEYIRRGYSQEVCEEYWKDKFNNASIGTRGFDEYIKEYFLWGFELKKLCALVNYNDKDNVPQYEKFIKRILDAKLHIKNKNCNDMLEIDQEEERPYSIFSLFAQFAFLGAENKKIDRYIPIEEIRMILLSELGDRCDVESIIEEYLQIEQETPEIKISPDIEKEDYVAFCEQDASEVLSQVMEMRRQSICEKKEKYDISTYEELLYYEIGDVVEPCLQKSIMNYFAFYCSIVEEETCNELMKQSARRRCEWLVEQNRSLLIRDRDWDKIFEDIKKTENSFLRYYPMVRVKLQNSDLVYLVRALILNDAFYDFCKERVII